MLEAIVRETDAAGVREPLDAVVVIGASADGLAEAWESYEQTLVAVWVACSRGGGRRRERPIRSPPLVATLLAEELPHLLPEPLRRFATAPPETFDLFEVDVAHGERITGVAEQLGVHRATVHASSAPPCRPASTSTRRMRRFLIGVWLRQRWLRGERVREGGS